MFTVTIYYEYLLLYVGMFRSLLIKFEINFENLIEALNRSNPHRYAFLPSSLHVDDVGTVHPAFIVTDLLPIYYLRDTTTQILCLGLIDD